jgi:hypothetical protein
MYSTYIGFVILKWGSSQSPLPVDHICFPSVHAPSLLPCTLTAFDEEFVCIFWQNLKHRKRDFRDTL